MEIAWFHKIISVNGCTEYNHPSLIQPYQHHMQLFAMNNSCDNNHYVSKYNITADQSIVLNLLSHNMSEMHDTAEPPYGVL